MNREFEGWKHNPETMEFYYQRKQEIAAQREGPKREDPNIGPQRGGDGHGLGI